MSYPYFNNLNFKFIRSPQGKPSVLIDFSAKEFEYVNGSSVKLKAEYLQYPNDTIKHITEPYETDSNKTFTKDFLNNYVGIDLWCTGYQKIYVKIRKKSNSMIVGNNKMKTFDLFFYANDPVKDIFGESYFATTSFEVQEDKNNIDTISSYISNAFNNKNCGIFSIKYSLDNNNEFFNMKNDETKYFVFMLESEEWKSAKLLYQDKEENELTLFDSGEDFYNYYPIEKDGEEYGKIAQSTNYWEITAKDNISINTIGKYFLRVCLIDNNNNPVTKYYSTIIDTGNGYLTNQIAYYEPEFEYNLSYEFNELYCTTETPKFYLNLLKEGFNKYITKYRVAENENSLTKAKWENLELEDESTYLNSFIMTFLGEGGTGGEVSDGEKTIYLQVSDGFGNDSSTNIRKITLYRKKPDSIVFDVIGSSGSSYYTGMYKNEEGHFIPSNEITVNVRAKDELPLEYQLYLDNDKPKEWKKYNELNENTYYQQKLYLKSNSDYGIFENNYPVNVNLIFRNAAGIETDKITKTIYFNTIILKTDNLNLRESSGYYKPIIEYFNGDEYVEISETEDFDTLIPKRSWDEIFYPISHSFVLDKNGNFDEAESFKIQNGDKNYDAVKKVEVDVVVEKEVPVKDDKGNDKIDENGNIKTEIVKETQKVLKVAYDKEKRPITIWNESTDIISKKYPSLESSSISYNEITEEIEGLTYWILDNTGYSDFQLEFEHFHLDETAQIRINENSPFTGDCLVIYDASEEGATKEYINSYGKKSYKLINDFKLKMLAAYTGDGSKVKQIYPTSLEVPESVGATSNGAFTTEKFNTNRICIKFYSDSSGEKSGFKIKSSPIRDQSWTNWEIDYKRGEIWLHKKDTELVEGNSFYTLTNKSGYCPDKVRASYEYSKTPFEIDYENGHVKFYEKLKGQLLGTFCYYNYDREIGPYQTDDKGEIILNEKGNKIPITLTFALNDDDLVDYKDASIYVSNTDKDGKIQIDKNVFYDFSEENSGKIIFNDESGLCIYPDEGLIEFGENTSIPKKRLFADYYCHSYYRLTDDGYGNLYFYDQVIVPDKSENYSDYTYVDLKVVNEGEATLRNGRIIFGLRGISEGGNTITSVLNPDRPWDVQYGTPEETYCQVNGVVSSVYIFPEMDWNSALSILGGTLTIGSGDDQITLTGGSSGDKNGTSISFGTDMEMKKHIYIRVVWTMFNGGSENSPTYISPSSAGEKCFSGEIEGSFYSIQI